LFENLDQAISRDILGAKLLEIEAHDMPIVAHVHDEGVVMVPNDPFSFGVDKAIEIMSREVDFCPGLLLGADGFESDFYHK
jgi:DNA polymerase